MLFLLPKQEYQSWNAKDQQERLAWIGRVVQTKRFPVEWRKLDELCQFVIGLGYNLWRPWAVFREDNRVMERKWADSDDHVFFNIHSYDGQLGTWIQLSHSHTC